ncbi:MAG TPA: TonB-dependent receptor [Steroidobacter sp.]|uniref:TonB-dependent receptor n=1 Tax=Steroidobacter sp. TaxID=1978227 RepID=UPI002EDADA50
MLTRTCLASVAVSRKLTSLASLFLLPLPVMAQEAETPDRGAAAELEEVVVTGTSLARTVLDTPLAATSIDEDRLAKLTANSQADILNSVPSIKAEGGGGEVAANVFIKGLPSGGQYQFTPLEYDGIPVFSSFGLNSSAFDVYYRNDLGIERLEFVRGGVSNLFGPGSVAGLINYISKTGSDTPEAQVQLELADEDRARGDFAFSGPLGAGSNMFYAVSGFYRYDEGPVKTGNDTEGFQLRGNLKREFEDGSGSITVYGQYIDDQVQFYLPLPLDGSSRSRIRGNDGKKVYSVQTDQVDGMGFQTPDGPFRSSIGDGVVTEGGSIAVVFDKEFGAGWGVNSKLKYADYDHSFDFFLDGDGVVNVPETQAAFIANRNPNRGLPATATLANSTFTYADTGEVLPADALLFANRFIDRDRPADDLTAELNLTKSLTMGAFEHRLTLGGFYGNAEAEDYNVTTTYLADFRREARLVNLVVRDALGNPTTYSLNGLLNAGNGYVNNRHEVTRYAVYLADQLESDKFIFDIGARFEQIDGDIRRERTATFVTDSTTPGLAPALRDVIWGNDTFIDASVDTNEWALALGALYKLTDQVSLYVNGARGYFFPEMRAVQINTLGQPQSYTAEIIKQAELGVKFAGERFSGTLAALYTDLSDRRAVSFVNDPATGGVIERVNIVSTESYGAEATFAFRVVGDLSFEGNVTWQEHEFTEFDTNPAFIGNELLRQPNLLYNAGLYYDDGRFDAAFFNTHTGSTYTTESNAIKLDSYDVARLDFGYTFEIGQQRGRVGLDIYNLFDDDGITEGSPRQDISQTTGGAYFVGRPVLPRRYTFRLTFNF